MTNTPSQETQTYEQLSDNHDAALNGIIDEIKVLSDADNTNDKLENSVIINGQLDAWLKSYLEDNKNVAILLVNHVINIDTTNISPDAKQSLQKLVSLLSWVVNWPVEWNESIQEVAKPSFDKFKKMIEEWRLNKLNTLKNREVDDVVKFVENSNHDISSLNLFADMFNQQALHGGDWNFRHTDRKNFYSVFNAIKNHFNMPEWAWVDTAKDIQLGKIFEGKSTKDDLSKIANDYLWVDNWDGKNLEQESDWKYAEGVQLIVDYKDFVNKFNEVNAAITPAETPIDQPAPADQETPAAPEVADWGFDKSVEKKWLRMNKDRVDKINEVAWDNAFLDLNGEDLKYNIEKVNKFLWSISQENFKDYYTKPWKAERYAWLAATQILLNQNLDGDDKLVVDWEYKRWGKTYNSVLNFQKKYNSEHGSDEWFVKLKEDGIPWPKTLAKLLGSSTDQPVEPANPDQPVEPANPDQPVEPANPDQPVEPANPDQPVVSPWAAASINEHMEELAQRLQGAGFDATLV